MSNNTFRKKFDKYRGIENEKTHNYVTSAFKNKRENYTTFQTIRPEIKTFDLIGYGTYMGFGGKMVTHMIKSKVGVVCHIGIAIRGEDLPTDHKFYKPGEIYVFESTVSGPYGDTNYDLEMRSCEPKLCHVCCGCPTKGPACCSCAPEMGFMGVMLRDLEATIQVYNGYQYGSSTRFFWCPLKLTSRGRRRFNSNAATAINRQPSSDGRLTEKFNNPQFVADVLEKYLGKPYDYGCCLFNLAASLRKCWCGASCRACRKYFEWCGIDSTGAIFCSELVTLVYQELDLISKSVNAENAIPMDYFGNDEDDEIDHAKLFSDCVAFIPDYSKLNQSPETEASAQDLLEPPLDDGVRLEDILVQSRVY